MYFIAAKTSASVDAGLKIVIKRVFRRWLRWNLAPSRKKNDAVN